MMGSFKGSDSSKFGTIVGSTAKIEGEHGGTHSYNIEERATFARLVNHYLKNDDDVKDRLPMNVEDETLFHVFDNGVLMCKLLMLLDEDSIDTRAINRQQNMNVYHVQENIRMGIAASKAMGIKLIGIDPKDFINKVPHQILTFIWQALKMLVSKGMNLKDTPEMMRLCEEGEDLKDLQKLKSEVVLIRWVNYHLAKAGQEKRITNLGKDLSDSVALFNVLHQLDASKCPLDGVDDEDMDSRAAKVIANALALGVPEIVGSSDITTGNTKVNTLFVAAIFNTKHGLDDLTKEEYDAAALLDDDVEGTAEERAFRFWINSLNIEGVYTDDLFTDFNDGILLNKVIHRVNDQVIDWKKIDMNPNNDFKKNINNNAGLASAKDKLGLKIIGVGGPDLTKGHKKSILAVVWQLARLHYLKMIGDKSEDDLVVWANELVGSKYAPITSLKDKALSNGQYLLHLLAAIEPRAVNFELMLEGNNDEELQNNAKYVSSVARKLGAVIFCVWEDIVNVNPKQMLIFFATMMEITNEMKVAK
jgi:plastin-1